MSNPDSQTATAIAPMLSVRRGKSAVEFYKAAFDAIELFRVENDRGEVVARMAVGKAEFWVADESQEHLNFSPESLGGGTVRMVLVVEDPDATFRRALAGGGRAIWPGDSKHGWRVGTTGLAC